MVDQAHIPEDEWIRSRIKRLRDLRWGVTDAQAIRAIDNLIAEAEERLARLIHDDGELRLTSGSLDHLIGTRQQ